MTEHDERRPGAGASGPVASAAAYAAPGATPTPDSAAAPEAPDPGPVVAAVSHDVAAANSASLPGEHRGGFQRELTEPVPITATVAHEAEWTSASAATSAETLPRSGAWALVFGILGLGVSFLVGWGFLIGLVGAGLAIAALRRPWESRQLAVWALCLSLLSVVYSSGWLWWASTQGTLFG
ncbi:hypothetical protein [Microbacterium lacticum]